MAVQAQVQLTGHARHRGAQSNLCVDDLDLVRRYGVLEHRTGVRFYFVGRREVERYREVEPRLDRLHGVVLVLAADDRMVITVYRNRRALRDIRRKSKNRFRHAA